MKNWQELADDYYCAKLSNKIIFEKYELPRKKAKPYDERVYEHLPDYKLTDTQCPICEGNLISQFVGKNAPLSETKIDDIGGGSKKLVPIEIPQTPKRQGFQKAKIVGAFLTKENYRISCPICTDCNHCLSELCTCEYCSKLKQENSKVAANQVFEQYSQVEKLSTDNLSCTDLLILLECLSEIETKLLSYFKSDDLLNNIATDQKMSLLVLNAVEIEKRSVNDALSMETISTYSVDKNLFKFTPTSSTSIQEAILGLKNLSKVLLLDETKSIQVIDLWKDLALNEATDVLKHYCYMHNIVFKPGDKTLNAIRRGLTQYGLAQTARFIYNATWYARKQASERGYNNFRAFNQIYGNLNFWIDDERARTYTARPFTRKDGVLSEPKQVAVFNRAFLEPNGLDYFVDPITISAFD